MTIRRFRSAFLLTILFAIGCGKEQGSNSSALAGGSASALRVDSAMTGEITGKVFLEGAAPTPRIINMSSEPACANANSPATDSREVITGNGGALGNVVVFVKSGLEAYHFDTPQEVVELDQKGCMYEPRVVAVMVNQPLEIHNDDATIHNVHAMPKVNQEQNKAQRAGSSPLRMSFSRPELAVPFMCNVHPWMRAFVFVFANPYYAVTTTAGDFTLKNVPVGTYVIEAWHEKDGTEEQTVTVTPHELKALEFRFKSGGS